MLCQAYLALKSAIVDHAQPLVTSLIEDFGNLTNAAGKAHLKAMREAFLKYGKDLDPAVPFLHAAAGVSWWIDKPGTSSEEHGVHMSDNHRRQSDNHRVDIMMLNHDTS